MVYILSLFLISDILFRVTCIVLVYFVFYQVSESFFMEYKLHGERGRAEWELDFFCYLKVVLT